MSAPHAEPARRASRRTASTLALAVAATCAALVPGAGLTSTAAVMTGQATASATVTATATCASGTAAYATALAAFTPAPTFWWRFDTAAGGTTVNDFAPAGAPTGTNTGLVRKTAAGSSGITFGTAGSGVINCDTTFGMLTAAGATDTGFVVLPTRRASPTTFTISLWVKLPAGATGRLLGFGNSATGKSGKQDRALTVDATGHVVFTLNKAVGAPLVLTSPATVTDGKVHFLVATLAPGTATLYVDGAVAATSATTAPVGPLQPTYLGYWRAGYDTPSQCKGDLDEVAVWEGTALTAAQVTTLAGANHWW